MATIRDIIAEKDYLRLAKDEKWFVGRSFYNDYDGMFIRTTDERKDQVGGISRCSFLLAYYDNPNDDQFECHLLRVIDIAVMPNDQMIANTLLEAYKEDVGNNLDPYTRAELSNAALKCRVLGTFYYDKNRKLQFGADVENFFSPLYYSVYKPSPEISEWLVNFQNTAKNPYKIGKLRYSSSQRIQESEKDSAVFVNPSDFLGTRTALFGMTRTGKSNTIKKLIEAITDVSGHTDKTCGDNEDVENYTNPFDKDGLPKYKVGQIIFDQNGEYANKNTQDNGTAIYEKYSDITYRYSVKEKPGFHVLKVNFYKDVQTGFNLLRGFFKSNGESSDYIQSFMSVEMEEPENKNSSEYYRWKRWVCAYLCCLKQAGFTVPQGFKVYFKASQDLISAVTSPVIDAKTNKIKAPATFSSFDPSNGITLDDAVKFWNWVIDNQEHEFFKNYYHTKGHDWMDEELKNILVMFSRKRNLTGTVGITGFKKLEQYKKYHTTMTDSSFEKDIVSLLRKGKIVIIDLSQGDPTVQQTYSEKISWAIFNNAVARFADCKENNFIVFYFEEAHNLFPKNDDLTGVYSKIAKEGAKLNLGLVYATQEVSSIAPSIIKNTQNFFVAHLNNEDELKEIKKCSDFEDFSKSIAKFNPATDKGFIRMRTYSNPFVVPVQIDKFAEEIE